MLELLTSANENDNKSVSRHLHIGKTVGEAALELKLIFGFVGVLSILINGSLCIVLVRKRVMTKKPYNLMILVLAAVDTLTGFSILTSPVLLGNDVWPIPSGIQGELFCRFIQHNFLAKLLWKYSVIVVLAMTVERWYAITHPVMYKVVYKRRNVLLQLISTLVFSLLILLPQLFQIHVGTKGTKQICIISALMDNTELDQAYVLIYSSVTVFVPFVIISSLYLHLRLIISGRQATPNTQAQLRRRELEKRLLRMNAAVAVFLGICFTPSQMCHILHRFGVVNLLVVRASVTFSMLNSIFNPWIYYFTNSKLRREMVQLLCLCSRWRSNTVTNPRSEQTSQNTTTNERLSFGNFECEMEKRETTPTP